MESAHERFLFTSCDPSRKRTSERSERVSFFYVKQRVNKNRSSTLHDVMFLSQTYRDCFDKFQRLEAISVQEQLLLKLPNPQRGAISSLC